MKEVERRQDFTRAAELRYELFGRLEASVNENGIFTHILDRIILRKSRVAVWEA